MIGKTKVEYPPTRSVTQITHFLLHSCLVIKMSTRLSSVQPVPYTQCCRNFKIIILSLVTFEFSVLMFSIFLVISYRIREREMIMMMIYVAEQLTKRNVCARCIFSPGQVNSFNWPVHCQIWTLWRNSFHLFMSFHIVTKWSQETVAQIGIIYTRCSGVRRLAKRNYEQILSW